MLCRLMICFEPQWNVCGSSYSPTLNLNRFELIKFELNLFQMYSWILSILDDDYLSNSRNASYDA